eukprot:CAMPEP_0119014642 /NCGR_PEP_ID=MMETSP1176-20130426/10092_1 /TAXON_ID=265551 /ORGANISM="Synedropsis recta cf, Strain CCMP1620" /LENGTH=479 /DNA_ID=CAMNT_0006967849 /DNA_START=149 /DNA_END=1588 /DNA_ORIENTATION=+
MVLTDRQRTDLHAGVYEYLLSLDGDAFQAAAASLEQADPQACTQYKEKAEIQKSKTTTTTTTTMNSSSRATITLLEKKWTAIPRLQKKVLELERAASHNAKIHAHRVGPSSSSDIGGTSGSSAGGSRRMLPRLPSTHTLQGHSAVVLTVQVHPVFTVVVSGSEDGTIKIWDHESGDYVRTLKGHTNSVTGLDFSPTGAYLVSSSTDLSMKLWDFSTYACIRTLRGHDHTISAVRFLPVAQTMNSSGGGISSNNSGEGSGESNNNNQIDVESAGSHYLLSASRDKTVKVWDVTTGFCDQTLSDHHDWVRCLAVRKHDLFATAGNDTVIHLYDTATRKQICDFRGHEHVIESIAFVSETAVNKSSSSSTVTKQMEAAQDYLASGGRDRSVRLWKISSQTCLHVFQVHENWVRSVLIHPSGNYIISAGDDRSIRVLDIASQRCLRHLESAHPHFVTSLSMHPTLPILVSGSVDTTAKCWMLD